MTLTLAGRWGLTGSAAQCAGLRRCGPEYLIHLSPTPAAAGEDAVASLSLDGGRKTSYTLWAHMHKVCTALPACWHVQRCAHATALLPPPMLQPWVATWMAKAGFNAAAAGQLPTPACITEAGPPCSAPSPSLWQRLCSSASHCWRPEGTASGSNSLALAHVTARQWSALSLRGSIM